MAERAHLQHAAALAFTRVIAQGNHFSRCLGVRTRDVVSGEFGESGSGWFLFEGAGWSLPIVEVKLAREGSFSFCRGPVDRAVGPSRRASFG